MTRRGEKGAIIRPRGPGLSVALVYPNVYRVGMGNLGFQFLYRYLNSQTDFSAERFFWPDAAAAKDGRGRGPLSEESGRPLRNFSVIAFSVPFESDYPAVPGALLAAGIPPLQQERGPSDPVIIAGGVSVSMNPEPLALFLDMAFIGEVDDPDSPDATFFSTLFEALQQSRNALADRKEFLKQFRSLPGAYIPSAYTFEYAEDGVITAIVPDAGFPARVPAVKRRSRESPVPVSVLFTSEAEFGESLLVETNRGCGRGCRFCAAGWIHFPVRHAQFAGFRQEVDKALEAGRTVGLIGSDLAGHPELEDILAYIVANGGRFSLSSIRPEGLTPRVIELLAATGQKTATLAPEVASPRMKSVIGKNIPSERFYELVEKLVIAGIPNIRFYFMVGLPGETDEDCSAIVDFVVKSRNVFVEASRKLKKIGHISIQVNPFVPKPWTPFQWAAMEQPKMLERRVRIIRDGLKGIPNLVVRVESVRQAFDQAFLSRGDRRIAATVLQVAKQVARWPGVFKKGGIDPEFYVLRERNSDEMFPWEVTDHGVARDVLRTIYQKAMGRFFEE
ncbi:MAG: radical SAM protein [Desulfomonile tiedjei]|nr:radical SAM protein [Desulfomonile tiedjei]